MWQRPVPSRTWLSILLIGAVVAALSLVAPVAATHSVPSPKLWFWDLGNDGDPDGSPGVDAAGSGWTSLALDRLNGAINQWEANTSFNPHYVSSGYHKAYRDGTQPWCGYFYETDIMVTCTDYTERSTYFDIESADTFAQTDANLPSGINRFWYGSAQSPYAGDVDFQGVMTHELGHWIRLVDLYSSDCNYGSGMYTMCGAVTNNFEVETWRMRTLTTDDMNAANTVY